jgi:hypothetical protein
MREQIHRHFGFEIVLMRTEVGGYCAHCQVLRAKELAAAAGSSPSEPDTNRRRYRNR